MTNWIVSASDRELFDRELDGFVPATIFDAHAHWYRADHFAPDAVPPLVHAGPPQRAARPMMTAMRSAPPQPPNRRTVLPVSARAGERRRGEPSSCVEQLRQRPGSRGQMLITPSQDPELIRETVRRCGFVGLKCYHVFSPHRPTFDSRIEEFLPESQVQVAHEEGLSITLHLVRSRTLADEANQETIRRYGQRYPDMRLILAHAARGFNPHHTMQGIHALRGLPNVWFDTFGRHGLRCHRGDHPDLRPRARAVRFRLPVSHQRGRCVAVGDSFLWISADNTRLDVPYGKLELALVGHESLRTLKVAAMSSAADRYADRRHLSRQRDCACLVIVIRRASGGKVASYPAARRRPSGPRCRRAKARWPTSRRSQLPCRIAATSAWL